MAEVAEMTAGGGSRGYSAKEKHRKAFERNPDAKYDAVISAAMRETSKSIGSYHEVMRNYSRTAVPLRDFKLLLHMSELLNAVHKSLDDQDIAQTRGLVAAGYQMMEQYVVDHGEMTIAWPVTHLPKPKTASYTAVQLKKGEGSPVGELTPQSEWEANARYVGDLAKHKKLQRHGYKDDSHE